MSASAMENPGCEIKRKLDIVKALNGENAFLAKLALIGYDYKMVHKTDFGQRIFTSHDYKHSEIMKGSEIFVGHLPRNIFEDTLIPLFSEVGKICEMRLMLEFSGLNRGFCFIVYKSPEIANAAIAKFHGYRIGTENICVYKSLNNCKLYLSNIPQTLTINELKVELNKLFPGIVGLSIKDANVPEDEHRGHVFVDFQTHKHAMEARKVMWPSKIVLHGHQINAEWAKPDRTPWARTQSTLIVKNLPAGVTKEGLIRFVGKRMHRDCTLLNAFFKRGTNAALLEFATIGYAEMALNELNQNQWRGQILDVFWLKKMNISEIENHFDLTGWRDDSETRQRPSTDKIQFSSDEDDLGVPNKSVAVTHKWNPTSNKMINTENKASIPPKVDKLPNVGTSTNHVSITQNCPENNKGAKNDIDEIWEKVPDQFDKSEITSEYVKVEPPKPELPKPQYTSPFGNKPFSYFTDKDTFPAKEKNIINGNPYAASSEYNSEYSGTFNELIYHDIYTNFYKESNTDPDDPIAAAYQKYMNVFEKDFIIERIVGQWILYKKLMEAIEQTNNPNCCEEALIVDNGFLYPIDVAALFVTPKVELPELHEPKMSSYGTNSNILDPNQCCEDLYVHIPKSVYDTYCQLYNLPKEF